VSHLTISWESNAMTISPGFTTAEVRRIVFEYEQQPYGMKAVWLADRGHTRGRLERWRQAVFSGDLDRGLIPRESGGMTPRKRREIIEQSVEQLQDAHDAELEQLQARIRMLEGTNDALGKAIGLLHAMREEEPDGPAPTTDLTGS
jgi:hypothetical protein